MSAKFTKIQQISLVIILVTLSVLTLHPGLNKQVQAASFSVNTTNDTVDANIGNGTCADSGGQCSLRAAVQESNALAGTDTINIPSGTYTLTREGTDDTAVNGDLDITQSVNIVGAGINTILTAAINGGISIDRIFDILGNGSTSVSISNLEFNSVDAGLDVDGGGIQSSEANLTLDRIIFESVTSSSSGGAIAFDGAVGRNTLNIDEVAFYQNFASVVGGAIFGNDINLTVSNSSFIENYAPTNGAVSMGSNSNTVIYNATFYGNNNDASGGSGAIYTSGNLTILNSTFDQQYSPDYANFYSPNPIRIENNIFGENYSDLSNDPNTYGNCTGVTTISVESHNISRDSSCNFTGTGSLNNTEPELGPIQNNGGFTNTMAITDTSPAFDAGKNLSSDGITTDQRGITRPQGLAFDIGAFEVVVAPACSTSNSGTGSNNGSNATLPVNLAVCGGSLTITAPNTITLSSITVSTSLSTATGSSENIFFEDLRANNAGWSATVSMTNLVGQSDNTKILTLANNTTATTPYFRIQPSSLVDEVGDLNNLTDYSSVQNISSLSSLTASGISNQFSLATFNAGSGSGRYRKTVSLQLDIPPFPTAQSYSGTLTFSIS